MTQQIISFVPRFPPSFPSLSLVSNGKLSAGLGMTDYMQYLLHVDTQCSTKPVVSGNMTRW